MRLRPYAASPWRGGTQVLTDVAVVVWVLAWVFVGQRVHSAVDSLATPVQRLNGGASGLAGSLNSAARTAGGLPLVGNTLSGPLKGAGASAGDVAGAGASLVSQIHQLAVVLGVVAALVPIAVVVVIWLPLRVRFALRAGEAARSLSALDADAAERLLAVRALSRAPLGVLTAASGDPVADVSRADPAVLARLAALERRRLGLR